MNQSLKFNLHFKLPFYKNSIKSITVTNNKGDKIANVQRFYDNNKDRVLDAFLRVVNKKNFRVKMIETDNESLVALFGDLKDTLFRDKWYIYNAEKLDCEHQGLLINKSKIATNPRFHYQKGKDEFFIKNDIFDKLIFVENANNKIIAKIFYEKITSMRDTYIEIQEESLDQAELILIAFIFSSTTD